MKQERLIIHAAHDGIEVIRVRFPASKRRAALQLFSRAWSTLRQLDEKLSREGCSHPMRQEGSLGGAEIEGAVADARPIKGKEDA